VTARFKKAQVHLDQVLGLVEMFDEAVGSDDVEGFLVSLYEFFREEITLNDVVGIHTIEFKHRSIGLDALVGVFYSEGFALEKPLELDEIKAGSAPEFDDLSSGFLGQMPRQDGSEKLIPKVIPHEAA
jgi:hypothetical protein